MLIAIHFARLGPYHLARLRSACDVLIPLGLRVVALEIAGTDSTYEWEKESVVSPEYERVTVFPDSVFETIPAAQVKQGIARELNRIRPDAMAIAGWGTSDARACLDWCKSHGARPIVMSETRASDGRRVWWKEWLKSRIVRQYDAALCGGDSHKQYLMKLGIPAERIKYGYNVVDNSIFAEKRNRKWGMRIGECTEIEGVRLSVSKNTESIEVEGKVLSHGGTVITEQGDAEASLHLGAHAGASASGSLKSKLADLPVSESLIRYADGPASLPATSHSLPATAPEALTGPYFLASNRFVERKNLVRLIRSYAMYVGMLQVGKEVWPLVLLGDGELRGELEALCGELGIKVFSFQGSVFSREKDDLKLNSYKLKTSPRGGCVIFAGFRQIAELPAFYGSAGAFIHPALSEPWGLVINEAMASGLPILSSKNVGAAEELLIEGETGFLFDPMDLQAISAAMHQIATLPEDRRQQMGESARELVEKKAPLHGFGNGLKALLLQK